jgi:hypothetical protein
MRRFITRHIKVDELSRNVARIGSMGSALTTAFSLENLKGLGRSVDAGLAKVKLSPYAMQAPRERRNITPTHS